MAQVNNVPQAAVAAPVAGGAPQQNPQQAAPFQSASLYVGDLHPEATEGLLFELFSRVGPVASIRVCRDAVTRRSLGYAYVNFHTVQDAERALDTMNFTDIKDKQCRIMWSQRDPTLRKTGVGNIFIKNLAPSIDNKSLFDTFSVFGNILSCKVIADENGASKGFGYVHYETGEAAQEAIKKLDGMQIEGQTVSVIIYQRRADRAGVSEWTNLYVKQFPLSWTDEYLQGLMSNYGPTTSMVISRDADGKSKGFAFVNFATHEGAAAALAELNGKVVEDETGASFTLYASQAQKKQERLRDLRRQMDLLKHEKILKLQGMNLYVKNLDDEITDDMLREHFAPFGTITSARVMKDDAAGGISKGFGFVCYSSAEEATRAVAEMNNKVLIAKPITVTLHQRKELRQQQLAATFGARAAMAGGRGQGGNFNGFNMYNQQGGNFNGMMGGARGFNNRGPMGPGAGYGAMPGYMGPQGSRMGPQGMRPQGQGQGNYMQQGMMGGRGGGRGGMGPQGGRGAPNMMNNQMRGGMQGMPVKFNMQARNQPNGMPMQMPMQPGMPMQQMQPGMPMQQQGIGGLDEAALAQAEPQVQKNMIGERLYPLIMAQQPQLAGKITGMLLEMDNAELLHLIESPEALAGKIEEALDVLRKHQSDE